MVLNESGGSCLLCPGDQKKIFVRNSQIIDVEDNCFCSLYTVNIKDIYGIVGHCLFLCSEDFAHSVTCRKNNNNILLIVFYIYIYAIVGFVLCFN